MGLPEPGRRGPMTQERAGAMQCTAPARSRKRALAVAGAEAYRRDVPKAEDHLR